MAGLSAIEARHYRVPTATKWFFRALAGFGTVILALGLLDNEGGTFGFVGGLVCVSVLVGIWLWGERRLQLAGLYETSEGLRVIRVAGSRFVSWRRIEEFQVAAWSPSRVMIVWSDGSRQPLIGTAQGAWIVWDRGETRDIVAVLNERLAIWKAADGGAAPLAATEAE